MLHTDNVFIKIILSYDKLSNKNLYGQVMNSLIFILNNKSLTDMLIKECFHKWQEMLFRKTVFKDVQW